MGTLSKLALRRQLIVLAGLVALASGNVGAQPVPQASLSSDYLMAGAAEHDGDWKLAGSLLTGIWNRDHDPDILHQAFIFMLGVGDIDAALSLGAQIQPDASEAQIGNALKVAQLVRTNDIEGARRTVALLPQHGINLPLAALLGAWLSTRDANGGNLQFALDQLNAVQEFETIRLLHTALIAEADGNKILAEKSYARLAAQKPTPRLAVYLESYYQRNDKPAELARLVKALLAQNPDDLAALSVTQARPYVGQPTLAHGTAEAFYDIAEMLLAADHADVAMLYAQIAVYLVPDLPGVHFLVGTIENAQGRFAQAGRDFTLAEAGSPFVLLARTEAISSLDQAGDAQGALDAANALVKDYPRLSEPKIALGDLLRHQKQYAQAVAVYSDSLAALKPGAKRRTSVLFARAVACDQLGRQGEAEADLRKAISLSPDDALVLNYLGYLWADHDKNLEASYTMLQHASTIAPNDNAIRDSLGWVLYRMGRYDQAIERLEAAVHAQPGDSTMNFHLGDAYWRAGRKSEAAFQWRRALLNAAEPDAKALETRLQNGLPEARPAGGKPQNHAALVQPHIMGD